MKVCSFTVSKQFLTHLLVMILAESSLTKEGTPDKETAPEDTPVETFELSTHNNCIGTNESEFVVLCDVHRLRGIGV